MIKKLAVLVIEKADGTMEFRAGEKGEIAELARSTEHALNDAGNKHDVFRLCAFGPAGLFRETKWKFNAPAEVSAPVVIQQVVGDPAPEAPADEPEAPADFPTFEGDPDEEEDAPEVEASEEDEAKALRKKLRDAGIQYSPRAGIEWLRNRVAESGL